MTPADIVQEIKLSGLRGRGGAGSVIVAGWAMDNMKPRDFTLSVQPLPDRALLALQGPKAVTALLMLFLR